MLFVDCRCLFFFVCPLLFAVCFQFCFCLCCLSLVVCGLLFVLSRLLVDVISQQSLVVSF